MGAQTQETVETVIPNSVPHEQTLQNLYTSDGPRVDWSVEDKNLICFNLNQSR